METGNAILIILLLIIVITLGFSYSEEVSSNRRLRAQLKREPRHVNLHEKNLSYQRKKIESLKSRNANQVETILHQFKEIEALEHTIALKDETIKDLKTVMHKLKFDYAAEVASRNEPKRATIEELRTGYGGKPKNGSLAAVWKYEKTEIDGQPFIRTKIRKPFQREGVYILLPADADLTRDREYLLSLEIDPDTITKKTITADDIKNEYDKLWTEASVKPRSTLEKLAPLRGEWVGSVEPDPKKEVPEICEDCIGSGQFYSNIESNDCDPCESCGGTGHK